MPVCVASHATPNGVKVPVAAGGVGEEPEPDPEPEPEEGDEESGVKDQSEFCDPLALHWHMRVPAEVELPETFTASPLPTLTSS